MGKLRFIRNSIIMTFGIMFVSTIVLGKNRSAFVFLNNSYTFRLVRDRVELTGEQKRLKEILDDPSAEIDDEKLLVGGILDKLLEIDCKYRELYKQKTKLILVKIYEEIKTGGRDKFPNGFWQGKKRGQGFINAVVLVRYAIDKQFNIDDIEELKKKIPPEKGWAEWLASQKLKEARWIFGTNDLIREALKKELYPNKETEPHLHEWEILSRIDWYSLEGERIIKEAVSHILEDHMGLILDESFIGKIENWNEWAEEYNLKSMLRKRFNYSGREMLKFVFPEKFYPNKGHVWHDWDFVIYSWDTEEGDWVARHWIRHKLFDPQHGEGWSIEGLAERVDSWVEWMNKDPKFSAMIRSKFGSILPALKYALEEEFAEGKLTVADFKFNYGRGIAEIESPLTPLTKDPYSRVRKGIGRVVYSFGVEYEGYYVAHIAEDFGGLFKKQDGVYELIAEFSLVDWEGPSTLTVPAAKLLRRPSEEYVQYLTDLEVAPISEGEAKQILTDVFGIKISQLTRREMVRLIVYLNLRGEEGLRSFLDQAGPYGLTVLGNISELKIAENLVTLYFKDRAFEQYAEIHNRIETVAKSFGLRARRIESGEINPSDIPQMGKSAPILLEEAIVSSLIKANNQLMKLLEENSTNRGIVRKIINAQAKLLFLVKMLEEFRGKDLGEPIILDDGAEEYRFTFQEKLVRLILRPEESMEGEASIRFTISPAQYDEIGFRIDRTKSRNIPELEQKVLIVDIDLSKFISRELFDYHFELTEEHELKLADQDIFSWLVRMVY